MFGTRAVASARRHWPMHGPQALASTVPPIVLRATAIWPSRSIVARTCSEPGRDQERHRGLEAVRLGLLGDVGGAAHVLVGGVGAAADQRGRDRVDEAVLRVAHLGGELRDRARAVGRMRADDVRLQLRQIDLDDAVVVLLGVGLDLRVGLEQMLVLLSASGASAAAAGGAQICRHALVGREDRGRGAELGAHVGDRRLAGGADRARAGADSIR